MKLDQSPFDGVPYGELNSLDYYHPSVNKSSGFTFITLDEKCPILGQKEVSARKVEGGSSDSNGESKGGIGWLSAAFGFANASIGMGILNYPQLYSKIGGIQNATLIQVILILMLFLSMSILIYCAHLKHSTSYHEILSDMCGPTAKVLVALDIFVTTYGVCVAYLVIIGDQYDRLFASLVGPSFCSQWFMTRQFTISATSMVILPICLLKKLDFLKHTGPMGMFAMLYIVFLSAYDFYNKSQTGFEVEESAHENDPSFNHILPYIPVILTGYQCNEVIVPIYASMKDKRVGTFLKSAFLAYGCAMLLYCTVGSMGYLTYGSTVAPNIMLMFDASDPLVIVGVFALIFKMIVTYPQMAFAGREAAKGFKFPASKSEYEPIASSEDSVGHRDESTKRRITISILWFSTSVLISLFVPHMGIVLQVLGLLAILNVFICPALCLISLSFSKDENCKRVHPFKQGALLLLSLVLIVLGAAFMYYVAHQTYQDIAEYIKEGGPQSLCRI